MRYTPLVLFILLLIGCTKKPADQLRLFSELSSEETGIEFRNDLTENEFNLMDYMYFYNGGGVSIGDINNDGLKDIFFTANQLPNRLYLNKGGLQFEEITEKAGVSAINGWTTGTTMADVNGDGYLDIYVCQLGNYLHLTGKNQLYINNHNGTFTESASEYGLDFSGYSTQALFFDYDNDNDLDLYLLNHAVHTDRVYKEASVRNNIDSLAGDRLYRNELTESSKPTFIEVTQEAGIFSSQIGYGLGVAAGDVNLDGFIDLYISNDFHENDYLYLNLGDGTFKESLEESMGHSSRYSMGNDMADINNDGLPDIITLDMLPRDESILKKSVGEDSYDVYEIKLNKGYHHQFVRNTLQLNRGNNKFSDIALMTGIYATDWSWASLICDLDNDGKKDIYISNGIFKRPNDLDYVNYHSNNSQRLYRNYSQDSVDRFLLEMMPTLKITNYAFSGTGNYTFEDKTVEWGLDIPSYSNGMAYADLDNDGDMDLVINNVNEEAQIYRNNSDSLLSNHYLKIKLKGPQGNQFGIGAKILLYLGEEILFHEAVPTRGFLSSVDPEINIGLGSTTQFDSLIIVWPGNKYQSVKVQNVDTKIELSYSNAIDNYEWNRNSEHPFLEEVSLMLSYVHKENSYLDFNQEYLMPHKLSTEGPNTAVGDINGDGEEDIVLGGASGQATQVLIKNRNGTFTQSDIPAITKDELLEDVGLQLFDMDGDQDLDLFVASGGNEFKEGSSLLKDRLYENDGKGNFIKRTLPDLRYNSSCVLTMDMDLDGDEDLFIGSRSISGGYGESPNSVFLINQGNGKFVNSENEDFLNLGMVTDAATGDFNQDSYPDLAVVGEWMPLTFFYGDGSGNFRMEQMSFTEGWWNSIIAEDFDNDGDLDLVAGNLGLNSKLKASPEEPMTLYLKDFDNDGQMDQVLCTFKEGKSVPFASRDELIKQMAGLKKKFPAYLDYSNVQSIENLIGEENLKDAEVKKAYLFETMLFENMGNESFEIHNLPAEIQFSPVQTMLALDVNNDGLKDLITAGNFYGAVINRGRYDAGYGVLLLNKGANEFSILKNSLNIDGDVRDMAKLNIDSQEYIIVTRNNKNAQLFKINRPTP